MKYVIKRAVLAPSLKGEWDSPGWNAANTLKIDNFRKEGSDHRPDVKARILYGDRGLHGIFRVEDRFVRSVGVQFQDSVCRDSCVEFFFKPKTDCGYFNFEFNCGGTFLCYYISDHSPTDKGFRSFVKLTPSDAEIVGIYHSMPEVVDPEISDPTTWFLEFFIPFILIEKYAGAIGTVEGQIWKGNLYKCAGATSHPHWASWSPVDELNFHLPRCFGELVFSK